ncbi:MFS transporter [Deinococcus depolymerans]|uniref:MFS transporter n=1 Tax=Deinococcus depolymerans TaxID=392408 RepID=UPI0031CDC54E
MTGKQEMNSHRSGQVFALVVEPWRALPPTVRLLIFARAVNRMGAFSLPFLAALLVQGGQFSLPDVGLLLGLFGAATIPSRLLGGMFSDRIGPVQTMVAGLIGCAVFQALLGADLGKAMTIAAVIGLGLAFELYEAPSQTLIADLTPEPTRPQAYGWLGAALAGSAVAAGLLAAATGSSNLHILFLIDALTCMAAAGLVGWQLRAVAVPEQQASLDSAARPWRDPLLLGLFGINTVFASVYLQVPAVLSFSVLRYSAPAADAGLLLALSAAIIALGQPILQRGPAVLRQPLSALIWGYVMVGLGFLASAMSQTIGQLAWAIVVASVGDLLLLGHAYSVVARIAPVQARARYFAVYGTSWGLAAMVSGPTMTALLETGGSARYWFVAACAAFTLAATQAYFNTWIKRALK